MQQSARYKRKQYIVARKFQLRYVGLILIIVFLTALMCSYVIYYTMMMTMGEKIANVYPQGRLMAIVNAVNFRILLTILLMLPLIIVIGVFASHKIAGPIFRIERFLNSMADGSYNEQLTLRRNDELVTLANGINRVVDSIKASVKDERDKLATISLSLENLRKISESKPINQTELDQELDKLNEQVSALNKELEKYKV